MGPCSSNPAAPVRVLVRRRPGGSDPIDKRGVTPCAGIDMGTSRIEEKSRADTGQQSLWRYKDWCLHLYCNGQDS